MVGLAWAADEPKSSPGQAPSAEELNKQLTNPVSSLWSIAFQQNNYVLHMGPGRDSEWNSNLNFQPIAASFLPDGWSVGDSGNILANWEAESGGCLDGAAWASRFQGVEDRPPPRQDRIGGPVHGRAP